MFDAEICGIPVVVIVLFAWYVISAHQEEQKEEQKKQQKDEQTGVKWTARVSLPLELEQSKEFVQEVLCEGLGCELARETSTLQLFERGDSSIRALPTDRSVAWLEFPLTIRVTYEDEDEELFALIKYEAPSTMTFSSDCARLFRENAENETTRLVEAAETYVQQLAREVFAHVIAQHTQAYEELGLSKDASWEDVQCAFRRLSKKYHPDVLTSKDLSPEIVNLASEKFKSIQAAYQRLKKAYEHEED